MRPAHRAMYPWRKEVKSSAPGGSFSPRRLMREKSTFTTGLTSLLITTFRFRQAGNPKEGIMATPSPASTMAIMVSRRLEVARG